jgi:LmbE family N-acetylglucosaminyl deacetylase
LLKLKASGARIYGLTLTRGEKGTERQGERELEAKKAAGFLGLDGHWVLDFPDTGLQERIPQLKGAIEAKIRELRPTMVLTHTDVDVHGDHRAVFTATREAARSVRTVLCYEDVSTTGQFAPNFFVDITHYIEDHLRACALHRTQGRRTYMDPQVIQGRAAHRGMQAGVHFAIAFRTLNMVR